MIVKTEMWTAVCDGCKKDIGAEQEYSCHSDPEYAKENAIKSGWERVGDGIYCPDCVIDLRNEYEQESRDQPQP